jgi:hypothetical protein
MKSINTVQKNNTFQHYSYQNCSTKLKKPSKEEIVVEKQTKEFGICPNQIFQKEHPKKKQENL